MSIKATAVTTPYPGDDKDGNNFTLDNDDRPPGMGDDAPIMVPVSLLGVAASLPIATAGKHNNYPSYLQARPSVPDWSGDDEQEIFVQEEQQDDGYTALCPGDAASDFFSETVPSLIPVPISSSFDRQDHHAAEVASNASCNNNEPDTVVGVPIHHSDDGENSRMCSKTSIRFLRIFLLLCGLVFAATVVLFVNVGGVADNFGISKENKQTSIIEGSAASAETKTVNTQPKVEVLELNQTLQPVVSRPPTSVQPSPAPQAMSRPPTSAQPTPNPSSRPSSIPDTTHSPSHTRTGQPTTRSPSSLPTPKLTTLSPSQTQSSKPSPQKTPVPTQMCASPHCSATTSPTRFPSELPSSKPSDKTTTAPFPSPSQTPSSKFGSSVQPTQLASEKPSSKPSSEKTTATSPKPSGLPSQTEPSNVPSEISSESPSRQPSASPSHTSFFAWPASQTPSAVPSRDILPSNVPSLFPSTSPSFSPSHLPTSVPIAQTPADTRTVTSSPTMAHSASPTMTRNPSELPTLSPSSPPTNHPSGFPSSPHPTQRPHTDTPTTRQPSNRPTTMNPSPSPSSAPSAFPSSPHPTTRLPSHWPTTMNPSPPPTRQPSAFPSSPHPTLRPHTERPTTPHPSAATTSASPTFHPTRNPTTNSPTLQPSHHPPTFHPTLRPTRTPTTSPPTVSPAPTPIWQEADSSLFAGIFENQEFGTSISLSEDGSVMAVGSVANVVDIYIFQNGTGWSVHGNPIYGLGSAKVVLSRDGNVLAIGDPEYDSGKGRINILKFGGGAAQQRVLEPQQQWQTKGSQLTGDQVGARFGEVMALSEDGNVLVAGEPLRDSSAGRVQLFEFDSDWRLSSFAPNTPSEGDMAGSSLALSSDGYTIVVGSMGADKSKRRPDTGQVDVYKFDSSNGTTEQIGDTAKGAFEGDGIGQQVIVLKDDSDPTSVSVFASVGASGRVTLHRLIGGDSPDNSGSGSRRRTEEEEEANWRVFYKNTSPVGNATLSSVAFGLDSDTNKLKLAFAFSTCDDPCTERIGWIRFLETNEKQKKFAQLGSDFMAEPLGGRGALTLAMSSDGKILAGGAPGSGGESGLSLSGVVRSYNRRP